MTYKSINASIAFLATLIVPIALLLLSNSSPAAGVGSEAVDSPVCSFTKHPNNPVLTAGPDGSWDDDSVWSPVVVKEADTFKMWYRGYDGSVGRIGLATSADGVDWIKHPSNPLLSPGEAWESNGIFPGSVISDTGTYKLWYTGYDADGVGQIGYATSPDGVVWTKYGGNPVFSVGPSGSWDDEVIRGPSVIVDGPTYHMWYAGVDGMAARIGHATSSDGNSWTRDLANPVLDLGPPGAWDWLNVYSPDVVKVGGEYQLWYSASTLPSSWSSGYATSVDGKNWKRQRLTIPEGPPGSFDADSADYVSVIVDGKNYHIWYSGYSNSYSIGYAGAIICDQHEAVYLPILMSQGMACRPYYVDDFSNADSGWYIDDNAERSFGYNSGLYEIVTKQAGAQLWAASPWALATDFNLEVDARRLGGYGAVGIEFAINEDWDAYYIFQVWDDQYSIGRVQDGSWHAIQEFTYSNHIKPVGHWNRLKIVRDGNAIAAYINGHHLGSFHDSNLTNLGAIALIAISFEPLSAQYDNFALSSAGCGG